MPNQLQVNHVIIGSKYQVISTSCHRFKSYKIHIVNKIYDLKIENIVNSISYYYRTQIYITFGPFPPQILHQVNIRSKIRSFPHQVIRIWLYKIHIVNKIYNFMIEYIVNSINKYYQTQKYIICAPFPPQNLHQVNQDISPSGH